MINDDEREVGNDNLKSNKKIRVIDYGYCNYLDSQAIYHAIAHSFNENSSDTLILISPIETYACIGYFQDLEKEIDIDFCNKNNIPVLRREVGGGAVLLDKNQLFFQFIFSKNRITRDVNLIYQIFLETAVNTYKKFGLNVYHRPINDLQIEGRKIGGTGAVEIGNSIVVVGSFMFDFNYDLMSKILKVPSEKFRDKLYQNMHDYVTNIKREFANLNKPAPEREEIKSAFLEEVSKKFNAYIEFANSLEKNELEKLDEIRKKLSDKDWLYKKGKFVDRRVKISSNVNIYEGNYKSPGGLIRVTLTKKDNKIADVEITGDFTMIPSDALNYIEDSLKDTAIDYDILNSKITNLYEKLKIQSPGVNPSDFTEAIKNILEKS